MKEKLIAIWKVFENFVLTTAGHAASGAGVGALFEFEKLWVAGVPLSLTTLLTAVAIGGAIGFFKTIVEELEKLKKTTAAGSVKPTKAYFM